MKRHPAFLVVAGWGGLNAVLLAVLALYGESSLTYWLWGASVAGLELAALLVYVSSRTGPEQHVRYRLPDPGAGAAMPAALGCVLIGLAFVYGMWLLALAVPLLAVALALVVRGTTSREE
ncbi:hypothetical protein [Streptomyces sp. EMB24]|uniref:hypothetical protein n=1 Tax=Streptomyces sp. EMB24 TaxID=2835531 RepID=UPI00227C8552|nr:hypothetical protein [Streptomyces sp. EMB24]